MPSSRTTAVIRPVDLLPVEVYDRMRAAYRHRLIEMKHRRRVEVGPHVSLLFESRETVLSQIQEVVWLERPLGTARIAEEIAEYDRLIPRAGELTATLMLHSGPPGAGRALTQHLFSGARRGIFLQLGSQTLDAQPLQPDDDPECPVQYIFFALDRAARAAFGDRCVRVQLGIEYSGAVQFVDLSPATRDEISGDLAELALPRGFHRPLENQYLDGRAAQNNPQ